MTTFFMLRLIAVLILIGFALLLQFLGELLESKPWRRPVKVLHATSKTEPSPISI